MSNFRSDIDAVLFNNEPISRGKVVGWIENTTDLPTLSKLYRLTGDCYNRIQPDLGIEATCGLIQRYLLECIRQNVTDDADIQNRFEAAQTLQAWFYHLVEMEGTSAVLTRVASAITDLFLTGDEKIRNVIETAFLEHVLETASLRPYFEYWARDARLRPAWERGLEWGKAHPDWTLELLRQIPKPPKS